MTDLDVVLIESPNGQHAINISNGRFAVWYFYKHPDSQYVTWRKPTDFEVAIARALREEPEVR